MFNSAMGPQYMPPANMNMPLNNHRPGQGGPGFPATQAVPPNWNSRSSSQPAYLVANNNPSTQYVPTNTLRAGPQTPHPVTNSNYSTQNVPTSASPGTYPGLYQASPATQLMSRPAQLAPQSVPRHGSMPPRAPTPGQASAINGQGVGRSYGDIIHGHHVPPEFRQNGYPAAGRSSQTPNSNSSTSVFNGGQRPQFMPPGNGTHQVLPPTQPVPQPMTRYNLPSSTQTPLQSVQGRNATPPVPVVSNNNITQGNNMARRNNKPSPATRQPATNPHAKRAADQAGSQQPTKKQRKTALPTQKPAPRAQQPAPPTQQPAPPAQEPAPPAQEPPTTTGSEPVVYGKVDPLPPTWADEPQHLPDYELAKIETSFVVDPGKIPPKEEIDTTSSNETHQDITKPWPEGKQAVAWDQAIGMIEEILQENMKKGCVLRHKPLALLRELSDAIEEYIARPGRDDLLTSMAGNLLNVRYVRVIEDGLWDGSVEFSRVAERDWDTTQATAPEDKEKVVKEVWEKRAREYTGPSLAEAQRQIFKY